MNHGFAVTSSIKDTWEKAYSEPVVIDYSEHPKGVILCRHHWHLLLSYRKSIYKKKINPLLTKEWHRINSVRLCRIGLYKLYLFNDGCFLLDRKLNRFIKKLPENTLQLPTSVTNYG